MLLSRPVRVVLGSVALLVGLLASGCGSPPPKPESQDTVHLRALGRLFGKYQATHQGKAPPGDKEFKDFVRTLPKTELEGVGVDAANTDSLFVSSRDSQPFVIRYKQVASAPVGLPVVLAYEKTGQGGKRLTVNTMAGVDELDEATFKQKVPEGP